MMTMSELPPRPTLATIEIALAALADEPCACNPGVSKCLACKAVEALEAIGQAKHVTGLIGEPPEERRPR